MPGSAVGVTAVAAFAVSSTALAGVVWVVQLVVYPGFAEVGRAAGPATWTAVHAAHSRRMTAVVALPWAVEGLAAAALLVTRPPGVGLGLVLLAAACAAATVVVTLAASVPSHQQLDGAYDTRAQRRLVRTNWLRTAAWTAAAALGAVMVARAR